MDIENNDRILVNGNLDISSSDNDNVSIYVRITPESKLKSEKSVSFISTEPLLINASHSTLVTLIETQYNMLMNAKQDNSIDSMC